MTKSKKPYFVKAFLDWAWDNGLTPHVVAVDSEDVRAPRGYFQDGIISLNVSKSAVQNYVMDLDGIGFSARFNRTSHEVYVPMGAVVQVFVRETGENMGFQPDAKASPEPQAPKDRPERPKLKLVK